MPQTSRGKFNRLRRTTAGSTAGALDGYGLRRPLPARPPPTGLYPVLVHRLASLLHASFGPRLAASVISPLRFANPSPPSGWVEDFHLQAVEHARHTAGARRHAARQARGPPYRTPAAGGRPRRGHPGPRPGADPATDRQGPPNLDRHGQESPQPCRFGPCEKGRNRALWNPHEYWAENGCLSRFRPCGKVWVSSPSRGLCSNSTCAGILSGFS